MGWSPFALSARIANLVWRWSRRSWASGKHDAVCRNARGVDLSSPVMALAWLFSSSCTLRTRSFWPRHHISAPYIATEVTAATTTLRIKLTDKPPLLLLRLDTRCRAPLALAILFSKCVLNNSFESSQKPSHLFASCLMVKVYSPMRTPTDFASCRTLRRLLKMSTVLRSC